MMEIREKCPFGKECETAKDGYIERCKLYKAYPMMVIATGQVEEIFDCSINWAGSFAREAAQTNRGQTAAIESFRNETVKSQRDFNDIVEKSLSIRKNGSDRQIEFNG